MIAAIASTTPSASRRSRIKGGRMRTVPVPPGKASRPRCSRRRSSIGALRLVSIATIAPQPRTSRISPRRRARRRPWSRSDASSTSALSVGPSAVRIVAFAAAQTSGGHASSCSRRGIRFRATEGPTAMTPNGRPFASDEPRQTMSGPTPCAADASDGPMRRAVLTSSTTSKAPTLRQSSATDAR
jgi:hypothetical protein